MHEQHSRLTAARLRASPQVPHLLKDPEKLGVKRGNPTSAIGNTEALQYRFPHLFAAPELKLGSADLRQKRPLHVGVALSGGQAPGGHNVIAGLYDALQAIHSQSTLLGFLNGPGGIVDRQTKELTKDVIDAYRNTGGFDIIGSGRTKIETDDQLAASLATVTELGLDGLVIIGGDDSNTNAAVLAEYFVEHSCHVKVIGVPKTIDGDLKNDQIEISFGHDTACRVYAELIGNLMRDSMSARKYYHFVRLMGRSASHITLECALQTHPNIALIGEEVLEKGETLAQITQQLADMVCARAERQKNYGVVLIPEGLIEFIPEMRILLGELNDLLAKHERELQALSTIEEKGRLVCEHLSPKAASAWQALPSSIQAQLLLDRDPHGNVQVSRIETDKLLIETVAQELDRRRQTGAFVGKFAALSHFFGYEGRSALPSAFDCHYCDALGRTAAVLIAAGVTGYMSRVYGLTRPVEEWLAGGVPLTMMMNMEQRKGEQKPVIQKALVDLNGSAFQAFAAQRSSWITDDSFRQPGPIQFFGPHEILFQLPQTLCLEQQMILQ